MSEEVEKIDDGPDATEALLVGAGDDVPAGGGAEIVAGLGDRARATAQEDGRQPKVRLFGMNDIGFYRMCRNKCSSFYLDLLVVLLDLLVVYLTVSIKRP